MNRRVHVPRLTLCALLTTLILLGSFPAFALNEDKETDETSVVTESRLLALSLRLDAAYSAGGPIVQGFYLPSVRLTASGDVTPFLDYRLSLGQTREYSTVLLPQMIPSEGYIDVKVPVEKGQGGVSPMSLRFGMFRPSLTPWWTPDLEALPLPDYNQTDQALFFGPDIGTELTFRSRDNGIELTIGAFNGSGITSLDSNNSRAFNGYLRKTFPLGASKLTLGLSGYALMQSTSDSINYKSDWIGTAFASLEIAPARVLVGLEVFDGGFSDSTGTTAPFGGAGFLTYGLNDWFRIFARVESVRSLPAGSTTLSHYQLGPILQLDKAFNVFVLYDRVEQDTGPENAALIRARLVI